jgi:hypothetical protein
MRVAHALQGCCRCAEGIEHRLMGKPDVAVKVGSDGTTIPIKLL